MEDRIESAINRTTAGGIALSSKAGLVITSMDQALEFAKLMSLSKEGVPKHCRNVPGICLSICIQGFEWGISPFALANKSYIVNDRICYEASLYQSVVARRAPIVGRVKMEFKGEGQDRSCRVWAELDDGTGTVDYTSPLFKTINPKNSPLWKNDPDQQLFYFSVRAFARRHFPDVMMGIYTVDEMMDTEPEIVRTVDSRPKAERLADRLLETSSTTAERAEETEIGEVDPTELNHRSEAYGAILALIATATIADADAIKTAIDDYVHAGEIIGEESGELFEALAVRLKTTTTP